MADEKIIAGKIVLDTTEAAEGVKTLNHELTVTVNVLRDNNKTTKESTGYFGKLKDAFTSFDNPLKNTAEGIDNVNTKFLRLLANPIVLAIAAIVGVFTLLYKAFTSTEEGGEKVEQIMSGIGAVVDVIRDRVLILAGAVTKFFSGDFKGAMQDAKNSVNGFKDDATKAYNAVADATRRIQEAEDELNRDLLTSRAKLNRDLAASRELILDENAGYKERRKAIDDVREAEGKQSAQELANAQKTLQAIHDKMAATKNVNADLRDEEAQAQAKIYAIQEQSAQDKRNLDRQSKQIETSENQKALAAQKAYLDQRKQQDENYNNYLTQLNKLRQENELLGITDVYAKNLKQIEQNYDNDRKALTDSLNKKTLSTSQYNSLIIELDKKLFSERSQLFQQHNSDLLKQLNDFEAAHIKAVEAQQKAAEDEQKARFQKNASNREAAFGLGTLADQQAALDSEVALYKNALDAKLISEQDYTDKVNELAQKRMQIADVETKAKQQAAQTVGNALNALSELVGKQTVIGKGLAIATATINTWQGASEALKQKSVLPSPFDVISKIANVATVIATGLNTVRQIAKVNIPGASGGTASGGNIATGNTVTPSAPITPQQASTSIDQSSIAGIGDATKNRAYVLENDITSDQNKTARLNRAARLGG